MSDLPTPTALGGFPAEAAPRTIERMASSSESREALRDAFLRLCRGDFTQHELFLTEVRDLSLRMTWPDEGYRVWAMETVERRLVRSLQRKLAAIEQHRDAFPGALVEHASLRGATVEQLEEALDRPFTETEQACCSPLGSARAYLRTALYRLRATAFERANRPPPEEPVSAGSSAEAQWLERGFVLLDSRLLPAIAQLPDPRGHIARYLGYLEELLVVGRSDETAEGLVLAEQPELSGKALTKAIQNRWAGWSRARVSIKDRLLDVPLDRDSRKDMPAALEAFDERFALHRKRKPAKGDEE